MTNEEIHKLAEQVCIDRLRRAVVVGHTKSGRVISELSEEGKTANEIKWFAMQQARTAGRARPWE